MCVLFFGKHEFRVIKIDIRNNVDISAIVKKIITCKLFLFLLGLIKYVILKHIEVLVS